MYIYICRCWGGTIYLYIYIYIHILVYIVKHPKFLVGHVHFPESARVIHIPRSWEGRGACMAYGGEKAKSKGLTLTLVAEPTPVLTHNR